MTDSVVHNNNSTFNTPRVEIFIEEETYTSPVELLESVFEGMGLSYWQDIVGHGDGDY